MYGQKQRPLMRSTPAESERISGWSNSTHVGISSVTRRSPMVDSAVSETSKCVAFMTFFGFAPAALREVHIKNVPAGVGGS